MNLKRKIAVILAGTAAGLALATPGAAQVTADALLNKLVERGILKADEAAELKEEGLTNNAEGNKFKLSNAIKSMELFGDLRFRYEYRTAQLGPETTHAGDYDTANRWRYALRIGLRGDLTDDFYYGLRLETGANERSTWNTLGNASGGQSPYYGPFSKANNYSLFIGLAYLGWRPTPWLDVSIGRVPQPFYTTPMVWDSDYTPEGAVEKLKFTVGQADLFATFGQLVYQDTTPGSGSAILGTAVPNSDNNAYLMSWQAGVNYHINKDVSAKIAPVLYSYVGHGSGSAGFYGPFVGQGEPNGLQFASLTTGTSTLPGLAAGSYNQTGINNLFILELPEEVNFKLGSLDAQSGVLRFGDFELRFGLRHGFVGANARLVQSFGQVERLSIRNHRGIQQLL